MWCFLGVGWRESLNFFPPLFLFVLVYFFLGGTANMTIAGTLEWVRFEWVSDRSVRLHIRESTLSFSA